jgi:hypothetical protein
MSIPTNNVTNIDNAILRRLERIELTIQRILVEYSGAAKKDFRLISEKELAANLNLSILQVRQLQINGLLKLEKLPHCRNRFYDRNQVEEALLQTEKH